MRILLRDLRFASRMLTKAPGFATLAVLTLALGIGANTAVFSIVNGVLLNPLPYPDPGELVALHESKPNFPNGAISFPNFVDWRAGTRTFSEMAVYRGTSFLLTGRGEAEQIRGELVSDGFFRLLGVHPALGREFASGDDRTGGAPIAVVSAGFWRRKLGGAPAILGTTLTLDGRSYTIVGVVPGSFDLRVGGFQPSDVYVPIGTWGNPALRNRSAGLGIHGIGRLRRGVTLEQARADLAGVAQNLARAYPESNKDVGARLVSLKAQMVGEIQPVLLLLLAAVAFVLLIACANIGNLLLARATGRTREFAVRAALGAGRGRLVRQLLTENLLLGLVGGALGLLIATWGTEAALAVVPAALPRADAVAIDARVLLFTLGLSLLTTVLVGLGPALRISRADLRAVLQEGGRGSSRGRHRVQAVLVVVELSLALVLLAGAGLTVRTLLRLWSVDTGFRPDDVSVFGLTLDPAMSSAQPETIRRAFRAIDDRLSAIPGTQGVSLSWGAVPILSEDDQTFWLAGTPQPSSFFDMNMTLSYVVDPAYLEAMGLTLLRGRFLTDSDGVSTPPVAVIDDVFARTYFGKTDPIGRRLNVTNPSREVEIVGVVKHVRQWGIDTDDQQSLRAELYQSFRQMPDDIVTLAGSGTTFVIRSRRTGADLVSVLRGTLGTSDGRPVVYGLQRMNDAIAGSLAQRRFSMVVLSTFAGMALLLACLGIYGVIASLVAGRMHELAIRVALGARSADVLRLVFKDATWMIGPGIVLGLGAALALTRVMANLVYGVSPTDVPTFAAVAVLLAVVALLACYVPARRAVRADPLRALRDE